MKKEELQKQGELLKEGLLAGKDTQREDRKKLKLNFTQRECEFFYERALLSEEQFKILVLTSQDNSQTQISLKMNMSVETVKKNIREIKDKIIRVIREGF